MSRYTDLAPHKAVDRRFEDHYPIWRPKYDAMHELARFLSGDRYVNDGGAFNKERRGVQIRGQDISDTIRHRVAYVTAKARSVEARPIDTDSDPDAAELMVSLVTNELADPYKGFEHERYQALTSAFEMRLGVVWMDWVPDHGAYGDIFYGYQAPDRIMWEAPYHPHHPLCSWLIRDKRIQIDQARDLYDAPWLEPDKQQLDRNGNWKAGTPLIQGYNDWLAATCAEDDKVTIRECWYKNDRTYSQRKKQQSYEPLKPEDRYLSCQDGCGLRTETQGTLQTLGALKGPLPPTVEQGCPTCGGNLTRIDAQEMSATVLAYSRGRRLVMTAPYSPNPKDVPVYDGSWPVSRARSFPAYFAFASVKPGDVMGPCDADNMWDQQVAKDNLLTLGVQRIFEHRNYWIMPEVGINDYRRKRFEFREDQQNIMFVDMTKARHGPLNVEMKNGTGLDPMWPIVIGQSDQALTRYRPSGDLGLSPENSKDIAASTVAQLERQGEVPNEDFKRRDHLELSMFYGVVCDYIIDTYPAERIVRLNMDGVDVLMNMKVSDLPNFDFVVTDTPDFTGIEKEKSQAWDSAMATAMQLGPEALDAWGNFHNVPKSVIRAVQKVFMEKQQQMEQQAAQGMVPPGPGGGMPGMAAMESAPPGMNGNMAGTGAPGLPMPTAA